MVTRLVAATMLIATLAGAGEVRRAMFPSTSYTPAVQPITLQATLSKSESDPLINAVLDIQGDIDYDLYVEYRIYSAGLSSDLFKNDTGYGEPSSRPWLWQVGRPRSWTYTDVYSVTMPCYTTHGLATWKTCGTGILECRYKAFYETSTGIDDTGWIYTNQVVVPKTVDTTAPVFVSVGTTSITTISLGTYIIVNDIVATEAQSSDMLTYKFRVVSSLGNSYNVGETENFAVGGAGNPIDANCKVSLTPAQAVAAGDYLWSLQLRLKDASGNESAWQEIASLDMRDYD